MHRLMILVGVFVVGLGGFGLTGCGMPSCADTLTSYSSDITPLIEEWDDTVKLADQTPRMQLASQVTTLQSIKRKVSAMTVPECAKTAHEHLVDSMESTIDGFTAFLSQDSESEITEHFKTAVEELQLYYSAIAELKKEQ